MFLRLLSEHAYETLVGIGTYAFYATYTNCKYVGPQFCGKDKDSMRRSVKTQFGQY